MPILIAAEGLPAQSLLVQTIDDMLDEAGNAAELGEALDLQQTALTELKEERARLSALRANDPGYLLRVEDGSHILVAPDDIATLTESIGRNLYGAGNVYAYLMALLAIAEDGNELEDAIGLAATAAAVELSTQTLETGTPATSAALLITISQGLDAALSEKDQANRATIEAEIASIDAEIEALERLAPFSGTTPEPTPAAVPDAPEGFMNEPGYYVLQLSGTGWKKGGAGWATRIVGYANFYANVTNEVTTPTPQNWGWEIPPGTDLLAFAADRQTEAIETSRKNCAGLPSLGPVSPAPQIWQDGPHYSIVAGPITDWSEALQIGGNPRRDNNAPTGTRFWDHEGGLRHEDLDPVCERYGVSLTD